MTGWRARRMAREEDGRMAREEDGRMAREDGRRAPKDGTAADTAAGGGAGGGEAAARLRAMVPADLADVLALEHELFPDDPWTAEMFAVELAEPPESRLYLLAEAGAGAGAGAGVGASASGTARGVAGGLVMAGYAGMMFIPGGTQADVLTIAVRSAYWGQGIGSALLGTLLAAARDRGCAEVFLEVRADNPRAQGLYLRRGFKELGVRRGYYQPSGVDAIVMRKDLLR
jgi:[ribosomal protein S18]-alanine N-acetyltransferase